MSSPTQRSLALLKDEGWTVAVVEKWNMHVKIRQDLLGFADLLAIHPDRGVLLVQACALSSHAARLGKVRAEPRHRTWLLCGRGHTAIEVHAWGKRVVVRDGKMVKSKKGGHVKRWACKRTRVELGQAQETQA